MIVSQPRSGAIDQQLVRLFPYNLEVEKETVDNEMW